MSYYWLINWNNYAKAGKNYVTVFQNLYLSMILCCKKLCHSGRRYIFLCEAPLHEDRYRRNAPHILNLNTGWRWSISFIPQKVFLVPINQEVDGPQSWAECDDEEKVHHKAGSKLCFFKMFIIIYQITQYHIPEDNMLQSLLWKPQISHRNICWKSKCNFPIQLVTLLATPPIQLTVQWFMSITSTEVKDL